MHSEIILASFYCVLFLKLGRKLTVAINSNVLLVKKNKGRYVRKTENVYVWDCPHSIMWVIAVKDRFNVVVFLGNMTV